MKFLAKEVEALLKPFTSKMLEMANSLREVVDSLKEIEGSTTETVELLREIAANTKPRVAGKTCDHPYLCGCHDFPDTTTRGPGMP